ncbi:unnamed protein product [Aphanomyces euteiches]
MEQLSINGRPSGPEKVTIQFTAVGGAPIMKRSKFTVNGNDPLSNVYIFLRKQLRLKDEDSLVRCDPHVFLTVLTFSLFIATTRLRRRPTNV